MLDNVLCLSASAGKHASLLVHSQGVPQVIDFFESLHIFIRWTECLRAPVIQEQHQSSRMRWTLRKEVMEEKSEQRGKFCCTWKCICAFALWKRWITEQLFCLWIWTKLYESAVKHESRVCTMDFGFPAAIIAILFVSISSTSEGTLGMMCGRPVAEIKQLFGQVRNGRFCY